VVLLIMRTVYHKKKRESRKTFETGGGQCRQNGKRDKGNTDHEWGRNDIFCRRKRKQIDEWGRNEGGTGDVNDKDGRPEDPLVFGGAPVCIYVSRETCGRTQNLVSRYVGKRPETPVLFHVKHVRTYGGAHICVQRRHTGTRAVVFVM